MSKIPLQIKAKRESLNENQTTFGERFNVSHSAVSDWESGKSEAPYSVLEFVMDTPVTIEVKLKFCPDCGFDLRKVSIK